jgi:hypothetical protein
VWLSNPVLVCKKNTNEWRMCVDYTDLNKYCPNDPFGLPRIDQVIDSTAGCDLLCFLDFYSGYHQIAIKEEDQEKTAFITPFDAYCYTTMSFGLKNDDATYQRAIQACFKRQLNKNVKAYVDDMVVKTRNSETLIGDLEETFASLRSTARSSTRTSASSAYLRENYSASSSAIAASKPTREDLRHYQDEGSHLHQRRAEAYWVHGGLEQIHLEAWRTETTLLQTTQAPREVRVDPRGGSSSSSAQGLPVQTTSPHGSSQKGAATVLPRCDY